MPDVAEGGTYVTQPAVPRIVMLFVRVQAFFQTKLPYERAEKQNKTKKVSQKYNPCRRVPPPPPPTPSPANRNTVGVCLTFILSAHRC